MGACKRDGAVGMLSATGRDNNQRGYAEKFFATRPEFAMLNLRLLLAAPRSLFILFIPKSLC
jgi:hypothetical protein